MLSKITTGSINGINIEKVIVETDFSQGLPFLSLVGLPDATVRESKERIRSAIINSGFVFPMKRITINLSPADTRKSGSHFDLPMAVGIMLSSGLFNQEQIADAAFIGELSLDGKLNSIESCTALVLGFKEQGIKQVYLPEENLSAMPAIKDIDIYGVSSFVQLMDHLCGIEVIEKAIQEAPMQENNQENDGLDYSDVYGQETGKRAMQICAAGWHHIMMTGPPGSGKTMLASRLPTIMTVPTEEEQLEIRRIQSIAGEVGDENNNRNTNNTMNIVGEKRPFRAPHHTVTATSLMGGGVNPKPGELSLAHRGVLFLDELPEFERKVLDMLRQPLETGYINLSRLKAKHKYPCSFILVTAMNPCHCGFYNVPGEICTCGTAGRSRYNDKVSGPFKDRIDININVNRIKHRELIRNLNVNADSSVIVNASESVGSSEVAGSSQVADLSEVAGSLGLTCNHKDPVEAEQAQPTSSAYLKEGVITATNMQSRRYINEDFSYNSQIPDGKLDKYCPLDNECQSLLAQAADKFKLSTRAVVKVRKVSRTIADIEESKDIKLHHLAEAISYREPTEYGES